MQSDSKATRPLDLQPLVNPKENVYFAVCVVISIALYAALVFLILSGGEVAGIVVFLIIMIVVGSFVVHVHFLGHERANGIRVSRRQFPELMAMVDEPPR